MKKIFVINPHGGPVIKEDNELGFTEGSFVHALFSLANLASDHDIRILCPSLPGTRERYSINHKGVEIVFLGRSRWISEARVGTLSFLTDTFRYIKQEKPDVVMGNSVLGAFLTNFYPRVPLKMGIIHSLYYGSNLNGQSMNTIKVLGMLEKIAIHLTNLDKVVVVNPAVQAVLVKEGFSQDKIVFVGNGVNVEDYLFREDKVPCSLIYIGRLTELKRVSSLVEVVSIVKKRIPRIILHIVGDGPKCKGLSRKIEALDLSQNVFMHSYTSEREKIQLLSSSALYVSNSIFEGFGIPVVEAMATGTVPVVSDIESHRFIFQGEDAGCLVTNEEEMAARTIDLLTNETERIRLARNGRRLVEEKWTWAKVGRRYREIVEGQGL